jgi:phage terminase large subunit
MIKLFLMALLLVSSIMSDTNIEIKKRFFNDKFFPYLNCQCPVQIFYGGAGSGKSVFAAQRRVLNIRSQPRNYIIARKVARTIRNSVFAETRKAISTLHLNREFKISESDLSITFLPADRKMLFLGLDSVEKAQSITVNTGVITDLEIEEATEVTRDDYEKLSLRLRGKCGIIKRHCFYFNPIFRSHWIAKNFFNGQWIKYKYDKKLLIVHSTHWDNKFLEQQDHDAIENKTGYYHDVYAKGKWGVLGDLIFTNWSIGDCRDLHFDTTRYGLDFGYKPDPAAVLKVGIDIPRKTLYVQQEIYGHNWTNDILAKYAKPMINGNVVYCDSAEPKSIQELRNQGPYSLTANAVVKGPDSVYHSLQWLNQWMIVVDKRCSNTINELSQYQWAKDKNGETIPEPVGINDHCIAALRYATERDRLPGARIVT